MGELTISSEAEPGREGGWVLGTSAGGARAQHSSFHGRQRNETELAQPFVGAASYLSRTRGIA